MRVGIIGTGWGRMHVGAFRACGASVVAVCGRDAERTRAVGQAEGIPLATTDVSELCAAAELVVVASADDAHAGHVAEATRQGRAVLCEKPLCTSVDEARVMVQLAARSRAPCAVSFPYRQLPPLRALRGWLAQRGELRSVDVVVRNAFLKPGAMAAARGGQSGDLGGASHVLDAALWLAGRVPNSVQALVDEGDHGALVLCARLEGGVRLSVVHRPSAEPGISGSWSFGGTGWEAGFFAGYVPRRGGWCVSAPRATSDGDWNDIAPGVEPQPGQLEPWAQAHADGARHFVGGRVGELASFREAAVVQAVIDAAVRSSREGRRVDVRPVD